MAGDLRSVILVRLGAGVFCSIPGIVAGRALARRGLVREAPPWFIVLCATIGTFAGGLTWGSPGWYAVVCLVVDMLAVPSITYRADLWRACRGRPRPRERAGRGK